MDNADGLASAAANPVQWTDSVGRLDKCAPATRGGNVVGMRTDDRDRAEIMDRQRQESTRVLQQDDSRFRDRPRVLAVLLHRDLADLDGLVQQAEPIVGRRIRRTISSTNSTRTLPACTAANKRCPHTPSPGELPVQSGVR